MKRKILMLVVLLTGFSSYLFAQQTITGTVVDKTDNSSLIGVSVYEKGTTNGTVTDFDGKYTLSVSGQESTVVFSFIGYVNIEKLVGALTSFDVVMAPDTENLDEVVVVGYGARKKSDVTGSVSSVKSSELNAYPVLNAAQAIQGRAAGVEIQSNNGGEPGAPIKITIRGNTSINASSSPLIVVDGFVGANMPQAGDIESMQILKDASATAIYGSQGANGVILITTKTGKSGKLNVNFNATYSVQKTANELDLLGADDFADYQNQIRSNQGNATAYTQGSEDTDWQDKIYRMGSTQNYQLSFSGASDNVNYYASGTYFKQDGILINSGYERATFLAKIDAQVSDKVKLGLNLTGGKSNKDGVATQSDGSVTVGSDDVVSLAMRFAPDKGIYNADGSFTTNDKIGDEVDNPYAVASQRVDETEIEDFRANAYLNYEILEGLSFKTTFGLSTKNTFRGVYQPSSLTITAGGATNGRAIITEDKSTSLLTESYLTYTKELGEGNLTLLAGSSYQKTTSKGFASEGTGMLSDAFSYYGLYTATSLATPSDGDVYLKEKEIQSLFGRVNYDYDDKYLITATVRRDGASNFAENEKYAIFPSAALGWKVSNESFLKDVEEISNLKLRASYGVTGNPSIDSYQSLASLASIYASRNGTTVQALTPNQPSNPDLKWESSYQTNLGVDLGLFDGKVSFAFDYYNIDTKDLILADNGIASYLGYYDPEILTNAGEVNNEGFEISINTRNITTDDFRWTTGFIFSKNKNTVVSLVNDSDYFGNGAPSYFSVNNTYVLREGEEVGLFYGYKYAGVYQGGSMPDGTVAIAGAQAGDPLFYDIADKDGNFDGSLNEDDKTIIGNPNPDFTWGLTNNFIYKNFDLSIFFQGSQGGEIFNMTNVQLYNGDANTTKDYYKNAWTSSNTNTNDPRVGNNSNREMSSRFVEDGSYVRLKNISLGYTLPSDLAGKMGVESVRFTASAQNLVTWTSYSGLDPEVNYFGSDGDNSTSSNTVRGFDFGNYPTVRSVSFSLNVTF